MRHSIFLPTTSRRDRPGLRAIGNSNYRAFLMRPTEGMSAVLNVEREIVTLFANYETFAARTLQALDKIYDQFDDIRIVCVARPPAVASQIPV